MSMDRNMKFQAGRQFNRVNEVRVSQEFTKQVECIALAHAAVDNMGSFQLMFNTLSKVDPKVEIQQMQDAIQAQAEQMAAIAKALNVKPTE